MPYDLPPSMYRFFDDDSDDPGQDQQVLPDRQSQGLPWPFVAATWQASPLAKKEASKGHLYHGAPPITRMLTFFMQRHTQDPLEVRAYRCMQELTMATEALEQERLVRDIEALAAEGSLLAGYVVAVNLRSGTLLPKDEDKGIALLFELADKGLWAASAELLQGVRAEDLQETQDPAKAALLDLVRRGSKANICSCTLLLARGFLDDTILLPAEEIPQLPHRLLFWGRTGCWEALDMTVQWYLKCWPERLPHEVLDSVLEYVHMACLENWVPAMTLQGKLYEDGTLVRMDKAAAQKWYERAVARGDLDAGVCLSRMLVAEDIPESVARARHLLEQGCSAMHAPSLAAMADLLLAEDDRKNPPLAKRLYANAANLGHAEPYVDFLGTTLMLGRNEASCRQAMDELQRLSLSCPAALYQLGVCLRAFSNGVPFFHKAFPNFLLDQAEDFLRESANRGHVPAMVALAEQSIFGTFCHEPNYKKARHWVDLGRARQDIRSQVLHFFLLLEACNTDEDFVAVRDTGSAMLEWAGHKADLMAQILYICLFAGIGYRHRMLAGTREKVQEFLFGEAELFANQLTTLVDQASTMYDVAACLLLARQLWRGANNAFARKLAGLVGRNLGLRVHGRAITPLELSDALVHLANEMGASHDGDFSKPVPASPFKTPVATARATAPKKPHWTSRLIFDEEHCQNRRQGQQAESRQDPQDQQDRPKRPKRREQPDRQPGRQNKKPASLPATGSGQDRQQTKKPGQKSGNRQGQKPEGRQGGQPDGKAGRRPRRPGQHSGRNSGHNSGNSGPGNRH